MADQTTKTIIVGCAVGDVYETWANFENFPSFMKHVKSVTRTGDKMSHWVVEGPLGKSVEWDAETTRLEKNKRIAWNSKEGSEDRKSTRLNSSHSQISYAVFCLKKKKNKIKNTQK